MMNKSFVSACCDGEKCWCGAPAEHKVEETILPDDPMPNRHGLSAYVCHDHFRQTMGPAAGDRMPQSRGDEYDSDIFTLDEWRGAVKAGHFNEYDGSGVFLDGDKHRLTTAVFDDVFGSIPYGAVYVQWFNK